MTSIATIILAAGKGTRMKSERAKVLHEICGAPLIAYPLKLANQLNSAKTVVVVGHQKDDVTQAVNQLGPTEQVLFAHQEQQLGTGHAVMSGLKKLGSWLGPVLILSGDVPLLKKSTLNRLIRAYHKSEAPLAFMTFEPTNPGSYGRVIVKNKAPICIREYKDCTKEEKRIPIVNAGIYLIDATFLLQSVSKLKTNNAQGEFYLTDLVEIAANQATVATVNAPANEVAGANDRADLWAIEQTLQQELSVQLMKSGVSLSQPNSIKIDIECKIGVDTQIGAGVHILGKTNIGKRCTIEPGAIITNSIIKDDVIVKAYSVLENATMENASTVGPMGRLRPGAILKANSHVGNWVELKNTTLGEGSKANHLAYLGDGKIGKNVNIGAGCIFCNYDGFLKHQTIIEDDVFVGSDSQIVAPATVHKGAYVATGSTITDDVQKNALAISRGRQLNKHGFALKLRARLRAQKTSLQKKKK